MVMSLIAAGVKPVKVILYEGLPPDGTKEEGIIVAMPKRIFSYEPIIKLSMVEIRLIT